MRLPFLPSLRPLVFIGLFVLPVFSPAQPAPAPDAPPPAPAPALPALPPHPRLLATGADFDRIRSAVTQPGALHDAFLLLQQAGERDYTEPPLPREMIGRRLLETSRSVLRRILNFALLHRLTGEKKWAVRAEQEMLSVAAFSDWNPAHFLDTAEAATGVALGYDWLYDALSPETRRTLREALVKHALSPGDDDTLWWRTRVNNWRQVCEAGLVLAALAVAEDEPGLAARAVARAHRNIPAMFEAYEPAGSYVEGPMYWDYGTTYHVLLVEALRTATGSSGLLADNPSFLQSATVVNLLTGPSGAFFNFGDCSTRRGFMPVMYWFARENRRPEIAAFDSAVLGKAAASTLANRFLALSLLWMPATPAAASAPLPAAWSTGGANPLAVFRHGEGADSLFVAMKGGRPRNSHGHMDAGGFVLELGGVRWAVDPGMPNYSEVERHGVALFGKDRWNVYVLGPNSHSIPLIDDARPPENPTATLASFDPAAQSAVFDLTPLYATQAGSLLRRLSILPADTVSIGDVLAGAKPGARYRFSWMTRAAVETDASGATLRQDGKTLRIDFTADAPFEIVNEDASRPPAVYDAPQPGLRRLSVLFTVTKPQHSLTATARLAE